MDKISPGGLLGVSLGLLGSSGGGCHPDSPSLNAKIVGGIFLCFIPFYSPSLNAKTFGGSCINLFWYPWGSPEVDYGSIIDFLCNSIVDNLLNLRCSIVDILGTIVTKKHPPEPFARAQLVFYIWVVPGGPGGPGDPKQLRIVTNPGR